MGRKRLRQLRVCHISHPRFKPLEPYSSHFKPEGTNHMIPVQTVSRLGLEADLILKWIQHDGTGRFCLGQGYETEARQMMKDVI